MLGLFLTFLKMGTFIFGSGHALAGAMQDEIVDRQKWMTAEEFQNGWAAGNILPGPVSVKMVAYVGYKQRGIAGAIFAVAAYLLPSVVGMVLVSYVLTAYIHSPFVKSLLRGIKPAVLALLVEAFLNFTGVAMPKGTALLPYSMAFLLVIAGVAMSVGGMAWIGAGMNGSTKFLLSDVRAMLIFALALAGLLVFHLDAVLVTLGAAGLGLTYLLF